MAAIPDAYLRRIQRDLPATAPEHLDYITDGMVNDGDARGRAQG